MTRVIAALCFAAAVALSACGTPSAGGLSGHAIKPVPANAIPPTLADLETHQEDVASTVGQAQNSYADRLSLYSLRKNNLVYATLEVSRLTGKFDYSSNKQRTLLADKIGGAKSEAYHVGPTTVYLTTGVRQSIDVWFRGRWLFVLSVRQDYDKPRTLVRDALQVNPS